MPGGVHQESTGKNRITNIFEKLLHCSYGIVPYIILLSSATYRLTTRPARVNMFPLEPVLLVESLCLLKTTPIEHRQPYFLHLLPSNMISMEHVIFATVSIIITLQLKNDMLTKCPQELKLCLSFGLLLGLGDSGKMFCLHSHTLLVNTFG